MNAYTRRSWIRIASCLLAGAQSARAQAPTRAATPFNSVLAAEPRSFTFEPTALAAAGEIDDGWRFDLHVFMWASSLNGTIGTGDLTTDVDATFLDILEATDSLLGGVARVEVGKGKWAGFVDGTYMNLQANDVSGPLGFADIDMTIELAIINFGVMYRLCEKPGQGQAADRMMTLDAYAGARYTDISLELEPALAATREGDRDWVDPIVGAKLVVPLGERWTISGWGDVGGFGVASDFTWSATATVAYGFTLFDNPASVFVGYRGLGQDYTDGSGADRFEWDVIMHGPIFGLSLFF